MNISMSSAPRSKIQNTIRPQKCPPSPFPVSSYLRHPCPILTCHHQVFLPFWLHLNEIIQYVHLFLTSFTQRNIYESHHVVLCSRHLSFLLLCSISRIITPQFIYPFMDICIDSTMFLLFHYKYSCKYFWCTYALIPVGYTYLRV